MANNNTIPGSEPPANPDNSGITPTADEARILQNMRDAAQKVKYGKIKVIFKIHDSEIKHGLMVDVETRI